MNHQNLDTLLEIWCSKAHNEIKFCSNWDDSGRDLFFFPVMLCLEKGVDHHMADEGCLFLHIINCIERRGWNWLVSSSHDKDYKEVWGQISFSPEADSAIEISTTPCTALLAAYLAALEEN